MGDKEAQAGMEAVHTDGARKLVEQRQENNKGRSQDPALLPPRHSQHSDAPQTMVC